MNGQSGDCGCAAVAGRLLTLREMAGVLAVTPEGLRRRVHLDGIPHVRVGTELRFDSAAVLGFLSHGGEGAASGAHTTGTKAGRRLSDRVHGRSVTRAGA